MMSLIALIVLIILIARSRRRGSSWPLAMLTGVRRSLQAMLAVAGLLLMLAVGIGTIRAILHPVAEAAIALLPEGQPATSHARRAPEVTPTEAPEVASLPRLTPTPRAVAALLPRAYAMTMPASLPLATVAPQSTPAPPPTPTATPTAIPATPTPDPSRTGCDPAYPDASTCIPPGPPFEQGCAITDERRFPVLPPDPQGLDHDGDGIGCEPVA
jgi:hypothetical protein